MAAIDDESPREKLAEERAEEPAPAQNVGHGGWIVRIAVPVIMLVLLVATLGFTDFNATSAFKTAPAA